VIIPSDSDFLAEDCRRSFFHFFKEFWDVISEEKLVLNWHIEYLCDELQMLAKRVFKRQPKLYDLIINIPPGTTKTTITTIMFPVWCWTNDPTVRVISGSYGLDLSMEHAVLSRDIIRSSKFQKTFPSIIMKEDTDLKKNYKNRQKGERIVTSVGGAITGRHAHIIIVDDPQDPKKAASDIEKKTASSWMGATLASRKVDKAITPTITIMQRLAEDDVTGSLLEKKKKKVKHICLPARLTDDVKPAKLKLKYVKNLLDPIRLSEDVLQEALEDLTELPFAGQFMQTPAPKSGFLIKRHWFEYFRPTEELLKLTRHYYSDTAYGKEKSDNSATLCYSVLEGRVYIWDAWVVNLPSPTFKDGYIDFLKTTRYDSRSQCRFEPKATGISMVQDLRLMKINKERINVIEDDSKALRDNKETRVMSVLSKIRSGNVLLLANQGWHDSFLSECLQFPNGKRDDQVDTLSAIIRIELMEKTKWNFISNY